MKSIFRKIIAAFALPVSSFIVLIVAIAAKSLLVCFYTYTGKDKIYSLSASYNLLHGKGWTNSFYYLADLNREVALPFCYWPPGYGLLISPFQFFCGTNIYLSTAIFEIVCFIIFIALCRAILHSQGMTRAWLNISTLLLAFFPHDFIEQSLGTDLLALNFVLGFFYASIRTWQSVDLARAARFGTIAGICLFLAGFTRYIYTPVCLFMAIVMIVLASWKQHRVARKGYGVCLAVCGLGLAGAMWFQANACGSPFYTGINDKGIFWANLQYWHPALLAAFLNLNLVPVQLGKLTAVSYSHWISIFNWVNLFLYAVFIAGSIHFFFQRRKSPKEMFPVFAVTGFLLSAAIVGGLALLSLTHAPKYTLSGNGWTFIVEGRYHAFPVVFLQLGFLVIVSRTKDLFSFRRVLPAFLSFLFILLALNAAHQVYYTVKVAGNYREMKTAVVREQDYVYFEEILVETIRKQPDREILVASSDKYYPLLASMHGKKGIGDPYRLNDQVPSVQKPAVLFTVIFAPEEQRYAKYLQRNGVEFLKEVAGTRFYRQLLDANTGDH